MIYIVFLILLFFPMVKIAGIGIPTIMFLFPILLFHKKIIVDKKLIFNTFICTLVLMAIYYPVLILNNNFSVKDAFFAFYPFAIVYIFILFKNLIKINNKNKIVFCLKTYIIIQLLFCVIQLLNPFGINNLLENLYFNWQSVNAAKTIDYLEISYRAFGTVGSPIYLSIIVYLFAKLIEYLTGNKKYTFIAILIVLLAGARMPLLVILCIEFYYNVIKNFLVNPKKSMMYLLLIIIVLFLAIQYVPFVNKIFTDYFINNNDIRNDYSFSYRASMVELLWENKKYLILGGYGINNFPSYVDSEYIIRFLQFGIINYLLVLYPFLYMFKSCLSNRITLPIIIFIVMCMVTAILLTNLLIIPFVVLTFVVIKTFEGEKA